MARYREYLQQKRRYRDRAFPGEKGNNPRTLDEERRALRSEFFKKKQKGHTAQKSPQERMM